MTVNFSVDSFAPLFKADEYSERDRWHLAPFFTNLDQSVYVPLLLSPELIGALSSRASRAAEDLRHIYLHEFVYPFVDPVRDGKDTDESFAEKVRYGENLKNLIEFLQGHSLLDLFSNPRARSFYIKWLAEYGDDSIAQMAGTHLVYGGLSQPAIKHCEDQRIGLAPIEKSTRYVNYGEKLNGRYRYYTDPTLEDLGLKEEYEAVMDDLFDTYARLLPKLISSLGARFPEEKPSVVEKKAFDTLRGLLPTSTLSQVAFFGNGQSFEHLINRSAKHELGEIRWLAQRAYEELDKVTPAFLRRIEKETTQQYQEYLATKGARVAPLARQTMAEGMISSSGKPEVRLVEYDPEGEAKVITGILFAAPGNHASWEEILRRVQQMPGEEKRRVLAKYLEGRSARWQRVGRAFENVYLRFEIVMNIGAWRDLHRHRMLTQMRQSFSPHHSYDVPSEVTETGLGREFRDAIGRAEDLWAKVNAREPALAEYCVALAHRLRFMQWQNLRSCFWTTELRTIPEGHPDYRHVEQEKFRLIQKVYPLIAEHMLVNVGEYDFARRGQEDRIQKKLSELS